MWAVSKSTKRMGVAMVNVWPRIQYGMPWHVGCQSANIWQRDEPMNKAQARPTPSPCMGPEREAHRVGHEPSTNVLLATFFLITDDDETKLAACLHLRRQKQLLYCEKGDNLLLHVRLVCDWSFSLSCFWFFKQHECSRESQRLVRG